MIVLAFPLRACQAPGAVHKNNISPGKTLPMEELLRENIKNMVACIA
jgi:hypothetical protein